MIGIYKIENRVNGKVYIGQTINYTRRVYLHTHYLTNNKHYNRYLQRSWNDNGSENFLFELIEDLTTELSKVPRDCQKRILDEHEKTWIKVYHSSDPNYGYNLSEGGDGCTLLGERNPSYGKPKSDEVRKKISNTIIRNKSHSGKNNGRYGKEVSEETRHKISVANKGRVQTLAEKQKRNESMQKLRQNPQYISMMHESAKNNGLMHRKYSDDFVIKLRNEYNNGKSIKQISQQFSVPYESCRQMVKGIGRFSRNHRALVW